MSRVLAANIEVTFAVDPPVVTNGRRPFTMTVVQADLHRDTRRPIGYWGGVQMARTSSSSA